MKFVCFSDTHTQYEKVKLPKADVLIIAGDIGLWNPQDGLRFNDWLRQQPFKYKIVVGGNHDRLLASSSRDIDLKDAIYLEDSGCVIEGIKIWGSPYTPEFMDWYFMADRGEEIKKHWDMIPYDTSILITHGPPKGILDRINPRVLGEELGCEELELAVDRIQPRYHIFGHIHGGYGKKWRSNTSFINCSALHRQSPQL